MKPMAIIELESTFLFCNKLLDPKYLADKIDILCRKEVKCVWKEIVVSQVEFEENTNDKVDR